MSTTISFDTNAINQLDRLMRAHRDEMTKVVNSVADRLSKSGFGSSQSGFGVGGVNKGNSDEDYEKELKKFIKTLASVRSQLTVTERFQLQAARREIKTVQDRIKATAANTKSVGDNTDSVDKNSRSTSENTKEVSENTRRITQWTHSILAGTLSFNALTRASKEFEQAYKHGLNWNALGDTLNSVINLGLSPQEMMDLQAKFRRVSNTFDTGITGFTESLSQNRMEWLRYTGSMKDAAFMQGEFLDLAMSMGVKMDQVGGVVDGMFKAFKSLQSVTSITAEEFVTMQKAMAADTGIRSKLLGLQNRERLNYMSGLAQTQLSFQALGLQKDVAESLIKHIEGQTKVEAKERLRQGAITSVLAENFGMDRASAQELGSLVKLGQNVTEEQRSRRVELGAAFSEAMEQHKYTGVQTESGWSNELVINALQAKMPWLKSDLFEQASLQMNAKANIGTLIDQQQSIADRDSGAFSALKESIVTFNQSFDAWGASMLAALLGAAFGVAAPRIGRVWKKRKGKNPGSANPANPANPPGSPGGKGGKLGKFGRFARGGLAGVAVGGASLAAQSMFDLSDQTSNVMDATTMGMGIGATVGSVVPGLGTAVGAAVGAAGGFVYGMLDNQGKFDSLLQQQVKSLQIATEEATIKHNVEQSRYDREIKSIEEIATARGSIDEAEIERLKELRKLKEDSNLEHETAKSANAVKAIIVESTRMMDMNRELANSGRDIMASGMFSVDTTTDVQKRMDEQYSMLQAGGSKITREQFTEQVANAFDAIIVEKGITSHDAYKTQVALRSGQHHDYSNFGESNLNPIIGKAIDNVLGQQIAQNKLNLTEKIGSTIKTPEQVAELNSHMAEALEKIAADAELLERSKHGTVAGSKEALDYKKDQMDLATIIANGIKEQSVSLDSDTKESINGLLDTMKTLIRKNKDFGTTPR